MFTDLGTMADGDIVFSGWRQPMNDLGDVIGSSWVGDARIPFLYTGGRMTELPTDAGVAARPLGPNNIGDVVGACGPPGDLVTNACLWRGGQFIDLGTPQGYGICEARLASEQGDILAYALDSPNGRAGTFLLTVA